MFRLFLIGSSGFIGSAVAKSAFQQSVVCESFKRPQLLDPLKNSSEFQAAVFEQVRLFAPDAILNCSNYFSRGFNVEDFLPSVSVNVVLPRLIQEVAASSKTPFFQLGSYWQMPTVRDRSGIQSHYLHSKILGSELLRNDPSSWKLTSEILISDTWGELDLRDKLIPKLLAHARNGESKPFQISNPSAVVHLANVNDLAFALIDQIQEGSNAGETSLMVPQFSAKVAEIADALKVPWFSDFNSSQASEQDSENSKDLESLSGGMTKLHALRPRDIQSLVSDFSSN